jgi:hypothetical protein
VPYRPSGEEVLNAWIESGPDASTRRRVLHWLMDLMEDPDAVAATPVPGQRLPVVTAFVPGTDVAVTYFVGKPFQVVVLLKVESVPKLY